jgi:hypothetical protein
MSSRTIFLARLLGLYCLIVALFMFTHRQATIDIVTQMVQSQVQLFFVGLIGISAGLAMVLGHNIWSGGVLPVLVTVTGWLSLIKGLALLYLAPEAASAFLLGTLHYAQFFFGYVSFSFVLGVFLLAAACLRRDARRIHAPSTSMSSAA